MSNITEERIREIIREELDRKLSITVSSSTEDIAGEYVSFITAVGLEFDGEQISWASE